jgi:hypothetical protein
MDRDLAVDLIQGLKAINHNLVYINDSLNKIVLALDNMKPQPEGMVDA